VSTLPDIAWTELTYAKMGTLLVLGKGMIETRGLFWSWWIHLLLYTRNGLPIFLDSPTSQIKQDVRS